MGRLSFIVAFIGIALMCVIAQEMYSDKFDSTTDALAIINDDKRRIEYYNCVIDAGPCTGEDQKFYKGILFEAIRTNCKKCTDKQKVMLGQIQDWYQKNAPDRWNVLVAKSEELKNPGR